MRESGNFRTLSQRDKNCTPTWRFWFITPYISSTVCGEVGQDHCRRLIFFPPYAMYFPSNVFGISWVAFMAAHGYSPNSSRTSSIWTQNLRCSHVCANLRRTTYNITKNTRTTHLNYTSTILHLYSLYNSNVG